MPATDIFATPNMLNATLPLKQDAESQKKLQQLKADFKKEWVPKVWEVLRDSNMVHYARFTAIDDKYLQILTEFDGNFIAYSKFFAAKLPEFFRAVFSLVEGGAAHAPGSEADLSQIFDFIDKKNIKSLGEVAFSAIGPIQVSDVKRKLEITY
jgi:hypothetical protein